MTSSARSQPYLKAHRPAHHLTVVLVGIDGSGKTTAAHALSTLLEPSTPTLVLANYSGRRTMTAWSERLGIAIPARGLDLAESVIRSANVITNHFRARTFDGIVIMDRHLHCQQALRTARRLGRGRFIAAMTRLLPAADAVIFLDVNPEEAHRRILARGTDTETLEDLRAYRAGYLELPEYGDFYQITANAPLLAVLDELEETISNIRAGRGRQPIRRSASEATLTARGTSHLQPAA